MYEWVPTFVYTIVSPSVLLFSGHLEQCLVAIDQFMFTFKVLLPHSAFSR